MLSKKNLFWTSMLYDPEIGRFTQLDPTRDGLNWYVYCNDVPSAGTDPWGLASFGVPISPILPVPFINPLPLIPPLKPAYCIAKYQACMAKCKGLDAFMRFGAWYIPKLNGSGTGNDAMDQLNDALGDPLHKSCHALGYKDEEDLGKAVAKEKNQDCKRGCEDALKRCLGQ